MSKLEANLVLLSITFFWSIQYTFFPNVSEDISTFVLLTLTNAIGFLLALVLFGKELNKLTRKIVKQGLLLAALLFATKTFFMLGSVSLESEVTSFCSETYIVFIPLLMLCFRKKVKRHHWAGVAIVVTGLLLATGVHLHGISRGLVKGILFIALSNLSFALYMVVLEQNIDKANPILVALGQMFFMIFFGLTGWVVVQPETLFALPMDVQFWSRVLVVAVFVRGFTTIMQIYAQRYISALSASLIFSLETVFTLLISLIFPALPGMAPHSFTPVSPCPLTGTPFGLALPYVTIYKAIGCLLILLGVLVSDGTLLQWKQKERATQ